jgi:hypothetical protein
MKTPTVGITIVGGHRYENSSISGLLGKYVYGVWTEDPARAKPAISSKNVLSQLMFIKRVAKHARYESPKYSLTTKCSRRTQLANSLRSVKRLPTLPQTQFSLSERTD